MKVIFHQVCRNVFVSTVQIEAKCNGEDTTGVIKSVAFDEDSELIPAVVLDLTEQVLYFGDLIEICNISYHLVVSLAKITNGHRFSRVVTAGAGSRDGNINLNWMHTSQFEFSPAVSTFVGYPSSARETLYEPLYDREVPGLAECSSFGTRAALTVRSGQTVLT